MIFVYGGGGGGGGGEYLCQVKENSHIWISVKIACLRTRILSLSQTETLRFIHVNMKL